MVSFPQKGARVSSVSYLNLTAGIYAPYTSFGNYFVFGNNFNSFSKNKRNNMLLAHALSHMKNPESVRLRSQYLLGLTGALGSNNQPNPSEIFINPAYNSLSFVYGSHLQSAVPTSVTFHDYSIVSNLIFTSSQQQRNFILR